jgi:hypothetical protein
LTARRKCLDTAIECVVERGDAYGNPAPLFGLIAKRWSLTLGVPVTARQVALCMIDMKLARAALRAKSDTAVDIAGYAACLYEIDGGPE